MNGKVAEKVQKTFTVIFCKKWKDKLFDDNLIKYELGPKGIENERKKIAVIVLIIRLILLWSAKL